MIDKLIGNVAYAVLNFNGSVGGVICLSRGPGSPTIENSRPITSTCLKGYFAFARTFGDCERIKRAQIFNGMGPVVQPDTV
jgi:hypothetical protein